MTELREQGWIVKRAYASKGIFDLIAYKDDVKWGIQCKSLSANKNRAYLSPKENKELIEYVRRDADKYPQTLASSILLNYQHAIELAEQGQKVIYFLSGFEPLPENSALALSTISKKVIVSGG